MLRRICGVELIGYAIRCFSQLRGERDYRTLDEVSTSRMASRDPGGVAEGVTVAIDTIY